jgi:hypothetical protein
MARNSDEPTAASLWQLSSIVTVLAGHEFVAAVPGNKLSAPNAGFVAFLLAVNLAEGIWAMWLRLRVDLQRMGD